MAANYLNIKGLFDVTCEKVANVIKRDSPDEIRKMFDIKDDFTEVEADEVRKQNNWLTLQSIIFEFLLCKQNSI